jgi:hypothetical protein
MSDEVFRSLPTDLASVLRNQSLIVPQDAAVFEMIASWAKAPAATASAEITTHPEVNLVSSLYRLPHVTSATTPAGCY